MKIYLTRHGETDWNLAARIQGSTDTELNETGIRQAGQLADRLIRDGVRPDAIYTSPLKRAAVTAQILAEKLSAGPADCAAADAPDAGSEARAAADASAAGPEDCAAADTPASIPLRSHPGLAELNFGKWEGLTWDQVKEKYAEDYLTWHWNRRFERPNDGESYQELLDRVVPALWEIVEQEGGADCNREILVVAHSAIIISLQAWMDDTPFHEMAKRYRTGNAEAVAFEASRLYQQPL